MAMIDYGAVVIKNGKAINKNIFFTNMLASVGWTDRRRIRHADCNVFIDPDPLLAESNCAHCNRAKFRRYLEPRDGEQKELIADCHGEPLPDKTSCIDGNYYAYAGDPHFTVAFYKYSSVIYVDGREKWYLWRMDDKFGTNRKSLRFSFGRVRIHLKEVSDRVYHMSFVHNGDTFHIIYGYGIDPYPKTWHRAKTRYLGKRTAKRIDNLYRRLIPGGFQ